MPTKHFDSILLIDAGSTKTAFAHILNHRLAGTHTERGINPNYTPEADIEAVFTHYLQSYLEARNTQEIKYYGSGCASSANVDKMQRIIGNHFPMASIEVNSDLTAVCHALSPGLPAICGILGTGAATCHYDGRNVTVIAPSLGYMLGDQGSGTHLGKCLLTTYLQQTMPSEIRRLLDSSCQLSHESIIHRLYREPEPNRYMASFAPFILQHIDHPFLRELAKSSFLEFFSIQKKHYGDSADQLSWNLCGSIAYHFADIVREAAADQHCRIGAIADAPMPNLIEYYTK